MPYEIVNRIDNHSIVRIVRLETGWNVSSSFYVCVDKPSPKPANWLWIRNKVKENNVYGPFDTEQRCMEWLAIYNLTDGKDWQEQNDNGARNSKPN